ncbi:MAG: hypothetical protein IIA48_10755 [Bacteroidetes bacterium]|nr:hypothetical protein [Bacteroidota bacterium]
MKCFIASAFDYKDVDQIYDKIIKRILKEFKIQAIRVDRLEHNEDIDDKIFSIIDESDFCIVDLTYARPSVYYEAGYAFGSGKPVIYISRKDHFKQTKEDKFGNYRIHFDLQMKNIISWNKPDQVFGNKLRKRIKKVINPLLRKVKIINKNKKEELLFDKLSQRGQFLKIYDKAIFMLRKRGYKDVQLRQRYSFPWLELHIFFVDKNKFYNLYLFVEDSITKSLIDVISGINYAKHSKEQEKYKTTNIFYIVSLKRININSLKKHLSLYKPISERLLLGKIYPFSQKERTVFIHIIDNVNSISSFQNKFKEILDN